MIPMVMLQMLSAQLSNVGMAPIETSNVPYIVNCCVYLPSLFPYWCHCHKAILEHTILNVMCVWYPGHTGGGAQAIQFHITGSYSDDASGVAGVGWVGNQHRAYIYNTGMNIWGPTNLLTLLDQGVFRPDQAQVVKVVIHISPPQPCSPTPSGCLVTRYSQGHLSRSWEWGRCLPRSFSS